MAVEDDVKACTPAIRWKKHDNYNYRGANGFGYMCGVAVLIQPSGNSLRLEAINSSGESTYSCWMEIPQDQAEAVAAQIMAAVKKPAEKDSLSVESLMVEFGNWGNHPRYGREDWMFAVASKDTQRGYWDWVSVRLEVEKEMIA